MFFIKQILFKIQGWLNHEEQDKGMAFTPADISSNCGYYLYCRMDPIYWGDLNNYRGDSNKISIEFSLDLKIIF